MKLTPKQELFCRCHVETGNASEAYRRAYKCDNMKAETINRKAVELLNNGKITARVRELQEEAAKRNEITIDTLIQELADIMRFNPKSILESNGKIKNIVDLPDNITKVISEIKVTEIPGPGGTKVTTTVKVHNKLDAIEKLAKHLGFYEKDNKQKEQQQTVVILPSNGR